MLAIISVLDNLFYFDPNAQDLEAHDDVDITIYTFLHLTNLDNDNTRNCIHNIVVACSNTITTVETFIQ